MDTKFSVGLHVLSMIAESQKPLTSSFLATSVGTNPSYVRKVIGLLKQASLISSQQGKSGYSLTRLASDMSLLEIYLATQELDHIHLFDIHQNGNQDCPVGRYIEPSLSPLFQDIEMSLAKSLSHQNLQDVIDRLYQTKERKDKNESSSSNKL
ncbi:Rrf2 family transcriptional regulator [Streptococcus sp. sy004]|uniref:Rrf2 family transcriptional regulator n=1 Tax=Streptococcus sp. sy004 TaxID=2600149 RepID=UPI0011B800B0|nr:Rrf2 family transcriptional regulator [Streptococcus sp. sy004]TWT11967.1 Rrf2 family transcriptional regulator [Streptococcus sp. sy004]